MVVDVSRPSTYPAELENVVVDYFSKLSDEVKAKIKAEEIEYEIDVRCAIEDYVGPFKAESLYNELVDIMKDYEIIVYHSTKVLNKACFINDGLQPNEWNWYEKTLTKTLKELDVSEEDLNKAITLIKHEYDRKYINREPALCFYSDLSLIDDGESAGYEQFCENIGGELARWALKEKEPSIYKVLKDNGEQIIVKFKLPFGDIVWYQRDSILFQFISYVAGKYFWKYNYQVNFDGTTKVSVMPEKIMEFIPYDKEVDY
ncbi:MAG: hypothetical protein IIX48_05000 [Lachnospiraceae bacterium]|nr:hypothetical protein [Lachnospiraceae bacterium]